MRIHHYKIKIEWTGNNGTGTSGYTAYSRSHQLSAENKTSPVQLSSDPHFRGDLAKYNPEELLVASLSSCHMLWYLHLCSDAGIIIQKYEDEPEGFMEEGGNLPGRFTKVILRPKVRISSGDIEKAKSLHHDANEKCFIANSVNFPMEHEAEIIYV